VVTLEEDHKCYIKECTNEPVYKCSENECEHYFCKEHGDVDEELCKDCADLQLI